MPEFSIIEKVVFNLKTVGFKKTCNKIINHISIFLKLITEKFSIKEEKSFQEIVERSLQWVKNNRIDEEGISISSKQSKNYPEVTGYFIPTLYNWGEKKLAINLAKWLITQQNFDGSFNAPDGVPYTFDTGQVIRGLLTVLEDLPNIKESLRKACNWVISQIQKDGKITTPETKMWGKIADDRIHLYVLPPLIEAGKKLDNLKYIEIAKKALNYYKKRKDLIEFNTLSHFYGYILEALYDLEEYDLVREAMKKIARIQRKDGSIPAYPNVSWVCIPGVAQLAIIFYKLGIIEKGDRALKFLEKIQNLNGGFFGSMGIGADYFPFEEISWAIKFFLDACFWRIKSSFNQSIEDFSETIDLKDGRIEEIVSFFQDLNGKKIIDIGCGKGRFIKALKSLFPKAKFYGIDISEKMIKFTPSDTCVTLGSILNIPYPDEFFDFVYCVETLEHAIRLEKAIEEMSRILKPGGKMVIIDKNIEKSGRLITKLWEQWFKIDEILELLKKYNIKAEAKYITYNNFEVPDGLFIAWKGIKEK